MSSLIETVEYKGYQIEIHYDESAESPREWDGKICSIIMQSRDYQLNETGIELAPFKEYGSSRVDGKALEAEIKKELNPVFLLKLYAYIHSGISLSLSPWREGDLPQGHARFDSGQIGYVVMTRHNVRECFGQAKAKYMTKKFKDYLYEQVQGEIKVLEYYLNGNVYGYNIEEVDMGSCWGFYGWDHEESGLLENAHNAIDCEINSQIANLSPFAFISGRINL